MAGFVRSLPWTRTERAAGFPSLVAPEIRAGADRLAVELDTLGAPVQDRLPDPALAGFGQLVEDILAVLDGGSAAEYLTLLDRRDRIIASALEVSQASGCSMVVIPAGIDSNGVPFGVQVMGPRWSDERLLAIAEAIAEVTGGFRPPPGL